MYLGWLKELRTLCDLVKSLPNELKAIPKEGVDCVAYHVYTTKKND